ncbi:E3 ubiquitin-protein ligase TRIM71 [Patella vulgata]|uniref:E3 ubiquitin-protein ligase TRIM71 n=1 Tax=Patella vulgata TaxID=6465 RepID=UPI0024A93C97|nr:E3 ubiquitin-protein ligase TRIM71 [Patella vulgata]
MAECADNPHNNNGDDSSTAPLCSICLDEFKEPKTIDCQHSFCSLCLDDYIKKSAANNKFHCPLCRFQVQIPAGGITDFVSEKVLLNTEKKAPGMKSNEDKKKGCDLCKSNLPSPFHCKDCQKCMCNSCRTIHCSIPLCQNHVIISLEETDAIKSESETQDNKFLSLSKKLEPDKDICQKHNNRKSTFYCKKCSKAVCSDCFVISHNGHSFYDLQSKSTLQDLRKKLKSCSKDLEKEIKMLEDFSESLKAQLLEVKDLSKTTRKNIDEQVKRICEEVEKKGNRLKQKIELTSLADQIKVTNLIEENSKMVENLKSVVDNTDDVLQKEYIVPVLESISKSVHQHEKCRSRKLNVPQMSDILFKESVVDVKELIKQIGKLDIIGEGNNTFNATFSINDFNGGSVLQSSKYSLNNLNCYVCVEYPYFHCQTSVNVYLQFDGCKNYIGRSIVKVVNFNNNKNALIKAQDIDLKGSIYGYSQSKICSQCISWDRLADPKYGFLKDGKFTVKCYFEMDKW